MSSSTFATSWSLELASDCPELSRNFSVNPKTIATKTSETVYTRPEQYTSISGVPCWKSERIWRHSNCKKSGFERRETKVFNVKKDWNVILHCSIICFVVFIKRWERKDFFAKFVSRHYFTDPFIWKEKELLFALIAKEKRKKKWKKKNRWKNEMSFWIATATYLNRNKNFCSKVKVVRKVDREISLSFSCFCFCNSLFSYPNGAESTFGSIHFCRWKANFLPGRIGGTRTHDDVSASLLFLFLFLTSYLFLFIFRLFRHMTQLKYKYMVSLGLEPRVAEWRAQMNPLSYGGTPHKCLFHTYLMSLSIYRSIYLPPSFFLSLSLWNVIPRTRNWL